MIPSDPQYLRRFIEGSCVSGAGYSEWCAMRRFIAGAINRNGTILDVGCANGFLLSCLQEWSPYSLVPYGIDIDPDRLAKVAEVYTDRTQNFVQCDVRDFAARVQPPPTGFPEQFSYVYWNVADNACLADTWVQEILHGLYTRVEPGGRLILGFYGEHAVNCARVDELTTINYQPDGVIGAPASSEVLAWFERSV